MFIWNHNIEFTVLYQGEERRIRTHWGEYRTLRLLIQSKLDINNFGHCGGMGQCGKCMVEITNVTGQKSFLKRSEHTSIQRKIKPFAIIRCACLIPVNDELGNVSLRILKPTK